MKKLIKSWCEKLMNSRPPDVVIGDADNPYLLRWWVWPRNRFFNLYLHRVLRSDDDRALHDHPWWNLSYIVDGGYTEVSFDSPHVAGGRNLPPQRRVYRAPGTFKLRKRLPAGKYVLYAQAVDAGGRAQTTFTKAAGNFRAFTLR